MAGLAPLLHDQVFLGQLLILEVQVQQVLDISLVPALSSNGETRGGVGWQSSGLFTNIQAHIVQLEDRMMLMVHTCFHHRIGGNCQHPLHQRAIAAVGCTLACGIASMVMLVPAYPSWPISISHTNDDKLTAVMARTHPPT